MLECNQFSGMNVYEHGVSVNNWFTNLAQAALQSDCVADLRIPTWYATIWKRYVNEETAETIRLYQTFHDCGKPFCRTIDEQGRQHFPNHAQVSYETWMKYAETEQDALIGTLIQHDMDVHTLKGPQIDFFLPFPEAPILTLTALAEIYSNASHLNALDSDNFKIKYKQIDKVGKRLLAHLSAS